MTNLTLEPLATYTNAFAAEAVRNRLALAGIPSIVTGTDVAQSFSMGGAPQDHLLRVEVARADHDRARKILAEDQRRAQLRSHWRCGQCGEENEATFDLCWNCRTSSSAGEPLPAPLAEQPATDPSTSSPRIRDKHGSARVAAISQETDHTEIEAEPPIDQAANADLRRARRCTVIGLLVLPPLVSCYALYLLYRLPRERVPRERVPQRAAARAERWAIAAVNVTWILAWSAVWLNLVGSQW